MRQSVSTLFITGGLGIVAASFYYQQPPILYVGVGTGLFLCIVVPSVISIWNHIRNKGIGGGFDATSDLSSWSRSQIQNNPPTVRDDEANVEGRILLRWLFGYKIVIDLTLKNNRSMVLDELSADLEVTDLDTGTVRTKSFHVPTLLPKEECEPSFSLHVGRRLSHRFKAGVVIFRKGIEVYRIHFDI